MSDEVTLVLTVEELKAAMCAIGPTSSDDLFTIFDVMYNALEELGLAPESVSDYAEHVSMNWDLRDGYDA